MRVAVIGGGIIGLLAAHHLRRRGADVVLLERHRVGAACSSGNAGWVTPSISLPLPSPGLRVTSLLWLLRPDSPLYIKPSALPRLAGWLFRFWRHCNHASFERGARAFAALGRDTMTLYDELAADGVSFEEHQQGLLMVFRSPAAMADELATLRLLDYGPLRTLDADALHDAEPALAGPLAGGIHVLPERAVRPETVCAGVAEHLRRHGVEILEEAPVGGLRSEGRTVRAARRNGSDVEADAFLIATGAEAAILSAASDFPLPLQAGKGYSVTVANPRIRVQQPIYFATSKVGISPFAGAQRVAGTMELSGINLRLDRRRLAAFKRAAEREIPCILDGESARDWVGMRPLTPDGLPVLGRLPTRDNLFVATGHQMLGVTLAPATGKAMAELILDGRSEVDLRPFDPARFA